MYLEFINKSIKNGEKIHPNNDYALIWSVSNGHLDIIKYLVEQGVNINIKDDFALRWSAYNGYLEIVKYLVIDCNITIKEDVLQFLKKYDCQKTLKIINTRDFKNKLCKELNNNQIVVKKSKI
jgi:ankyrin repeat protein